MKQKPFKEDWEKELEKKRKVITIKGIPVLNGKELISYKAVKKFIKTLLKEKEKEGFVRGFNKRWKMQVYEWNKAMKIKSK